MENSLYKLVNPEFIFEYGGEQYTVRKANLEKAVRYQNRLRELKDEPNADAMLIAFCVTLILKDKIPDLNEEMVMNTLPADLSAVEVLTQLGFISPSKAEALALAKKSTSENSSSS